MFWLTEPLAGLLSEWSVRETDPVGDPGQHLGGRYLNAAAEVSTDLSPRELLSLLLEIERSLGRVRSTPKAPRAIDLDLLLFGELAIDDPGLSVPLPRLLERAFVLEPLAELAPARRHALTGRTLAELWEDWRALHDRHS